MQSDRDLLAAVQQARRASPGLADPEGSEDEFIRVSLPERDCDILRDLLATERAQVVIEIGLAYGRSALAIGESLVSQGHSASKHVIIDAYQDQFQGVGWKAMVGVGLDQICTLLEERSQLGSTSGNRGIRRRRRLCGR